eukprot:scaffold8260_cov112-Skeletonema_dohrnii-CCMP3373.AAC.5
MRLLILLLSFLLQPQNSNSLALGHPSLLTSIKSFHQPPSSSVADACRIFHGRGGLHPGADHLTLDYYAPVFLLTSFGVELEENELESYCSALCETLDASEEDDDGNSQQHELTIVYQCRGANTTAETRLLCGTIPDPHIVTENNGQDKFLVHLVRGQNHGLFLDMSNGRTWLRNKCQSKDVSSVLNLFSYTCAFSVAALNGGADKVVNIDMSRGALKVGQRNHELNGISSKASFLSHDIFKTWGKMKRAGPFDCIVVDPPSYQKGSFVAKKDYGKVIRRLPSLLNEDGYALLCLNAPEMNSDFLLEKVKEECGTEMVFVERLENPSIFESAFPERALKVLLFQYQRSNDVSSVAT